MALLALEEESLMAVLVIDGGEQNQEIIGIIFKYTNTRINKIMAYSKSIIDILKAFKKIGWDIYNLEGKVEYLPVGDNDKYDWQWERMSDTKFYDIISTKIANKERVGVDLFHNSGVEGISLLAYNTNQITLSIFINRKLMDERHTDMVWYLKNIVYRLMDIGVELLSYSLKEYED